jgi:hypothetical protein
MPWYYKDGEQGPLICTGPCAGTGFIPCPVNHKTHPFNDVDTDDGTPFFRCTECEWVRPDLAGENKSETAGMLTCPECGNGERRETYDGACDLDCGKRNVGAAWHRLSGDVQTVLKRKKRSWEGDAKFACSTCWHKYSTRILAEFERELAAIAHHREHEGKPPGTCTNCGKIDYLAVLDHDAQEYICVRCHPTWSPTPAPAAAELPPQGWYPDPDDPEDYLRWWSGTEWTGLPTLPEHVLTQ